ncbi:MAG: hypothetical protein LH615_04300, partial [Ferruginibacter sp.]|nr:hypothetical protein [Ferruginibacter sp.]
MKFIRIKFYTVNVLFLLFNVSQISAQNFVANKKKGEDLYAGIDVGSKGVKLSVIQMGKNASLTGS